MLQHKCCVQFEHCLFQFSVSTGNNWKQLFGESDDESDLEGF